DRQACRAAPGGRLDRAEHDTGGLGVRMLDIEPTVFDRAYNAGATRTLWFVSHLLYATPLAPSFDAAFRREWAAYQSYNAAFAEALAAEAAPGARVLVQDYHLTLVPAMLRARRPDVAIAHFTHTPWAPPDYFALLPDEVAAELCAGILGADHSGFLSGRWAASFKQCCKRVLGASCDEDLVTHAGRATRVAVHALGVDGAGLRERASQPDVTARLAGLRAGLAGRRLLLRVDRTELSKNIVRGLAAYRELLHRYPEWRERVVHLAFAYPSRHDLPEYREYTAAVLRMATEINDEFATDGWVPVRLEVSDDYPRSLAAMRLADVLVVNPIRDGMNLVAKEGPVLSDDGLALVLSREAGAVDQLREDAFVVNPYDVVGTAQAMHAALSLPADERAERSARLAAAATALPPVRWLADQLTALDGA
ncbi:MAG: alpha,alpha-trehalose-phosphate synthase (UDP-forming), partial [Mycobacteriales bacterium]